MNPVQILLIEDDPSDVELARQALKKGRIANELQVIDTGEEALKYLESCDSDESSKRPHLILLDLNLPGINGLEVLEKIKSNKNLRRIPVVIMTTSEDDKDVMAAYDKYANSYLTKPVEFDKFVESIRASTEYWFYLCRFPEH